MLAGLGESRALAAAEVAHEALERVGQPRVRLLNFGGKRRSRERLRRRRMKIPPPWWLSLTGLIDDGLSLEALRAKTQARAAQAAAKKAVDRGLAPNLDSAIAEFLEGEKVAEQVAEAASASDEEADDRLEQAGPRFRGVSWGWRS